MLAVIFAADSGNRLGIVGCHTHGVALGINNHAKADGIILSGHFLCSQQRTILVVHDDGKVLELGSRHDTR